jgi:hypothetical protein
MSTASVSNCVLPAGLACAASLLVIAANAQTARMDLYVDDPRPVAEAVLSFAKRYPTVVTYEDPRYVYSGDVLDVTERVRRNPATGVRTLIPRGGLLQVSYDVEESTGEPVDFASSVKSILEAANVGSSGGRFDLRQEGNVFHIVPVEVRDLQGRWVKHNSILDTPITLSTDELNGYQLTEAILAQVGQANEVGVGLAVERFTNTFMRHTGRVSATREPARDVLLRVLHEMSERFTYLMLYDPSGKYYVLNVAVVAEPPREIPLDLSPIPRPGDPTPAGPPFRPGND